MWNNHPILTHYCMTIFNPEHHLQKQPSYREIHEALPLLNVHLCEKSIVDEMILSGITPQNPWLHSQHVDLLESKIIQILKYHCEDDSPIDRYLFQFCQQQEVLQFFHEKIDHLIQENRGILLAALADYWKHLETTSRDLQLFQEFVKMILHSEQGHRRCLKAFTPKHHITQRKNLSELIKVLQLFSELPSAKP